MTETHQATLPLKPTLTTTQNRSLRSLPWIVCISATLFFFYEFLLMNMFNSIAPGLEKSFHVSASGLGELSAAYFWADVLFLFPAGLLLDRFSTRWIIILAMGLCVISTIGFALSHSLNTAALFRFLSGIGNAFAFLSCIRLASRWFAPNQLALVTGIIVTMAMLGGMAAQTPLTLLVDLFGWRKALMLNGLIGISFLFIIIAFVRDYPHHAIATEEKQALSDIGFWRSISLSIKNRQNWLGGIYTNLMNLPLVLFGAIYGSSYLRDVHHLTDHASSVVISSLFLGTIIGSPLFGGLSDRINRRVRPMLFGTVLSILCIMIILYMPSLSRNTLIGLFFGLGFFSSTQVLSYPLVAESNPSALTGTSVGLASLLVMSGYAIFQPLCGHLMDWHWQGIVNNDIPVYSISDYHTAFALIPIGFVISFVVACLLRDTYCQRLSEEKET